MSTWPSYAEIELAGFGFERASAVERTQTESGFVKQTRVRSRVMVTVPARVYLDSQADYLAFLSWFRTDINFGTDWFDWPHPVAGTVTQARIVGGRLGLEEPDGSLGKWVIPLSLEYWDA